MAKEPFTVTIEGKKILVYQNVYTGFFYTITAGGKHAPISYSRIKAWTTSTQRLKYWRNRYGYTQAELAKLIHVSSPTIIMMWENGLRHPREEYRRRINAELGGNVFPR
jgi:DNA-binding XRE family transcriptional regulator|nr:MAG TPA: helix-turn-helix domain protein [Caudoviricetes sp.]